MVPAARCEPVPDHGDPKYLAPFLDEWRTQGESRFGRDNLPEYGDLVDPALLGERPTEKLATHPVTGFRATGEKGPLLDALRRDIAELQRYPDMYTTAEPFTDRVFLYALEHASLAYLGGMWTRNRYARDHAVSWAGLATDYAALVAANRTDQFRALLYSFAAGPATGTARFWRLRHGRYRLTLGPDADEDGRADTATRDETIEIVRGEPLAVTLPPRTAMVLELALVEPLDDLTARPDLAISGGTVRRDGDALVVTVHNLGLGAAPSATLAVVASDGRTLATIPVPALPAPVDLSPSVAELRVAARGATRLVLDPDRRVAELCETNNAVEF